MNIKQGALLAIAAVVLSRSQTAGQPFWTADNRVTNSVPAQSLPPTATTKGIVALDPHAVDIV